VKTTTQDTLYRRKFPRRGFKRSVGVLSGPRYKLCQGFEIGEGGLSFAGYSGYQLEGKIVLNFQIPDGSFISVQAEIKNIEENRETRLNTYGCSFLNLSFEHKREIRSFVSARSSKE